VVKDNLDLKDVSRIESRRLELPELIVETDPRRYYVFDQLAAHVIGYMQELSPQELKSEAYAGRNLGDMVGRTGMESQYESTLVGVDGQKTEVVDSQGRTRGRSPGRSRPPGGTSSSPWDFDLQRKATGTP